MSVNTSPQGIVDHIETLKYLRKCFAAGAQDASSEKAREEAKAHRDAIAAAIAALHMAEPLTRDEQFLQAVRIELARARTLFPGDRLMTVALAEEFGELCKAVLDEPAANVYKEAVQTAVMAARVALDGDSSVVDWRQQKGLDPLVTG